MGIDEPFIADLVDRFYSAVREDAMLGPVFDARVDDWPKHLGQMNRFWQSILLSAGNFVGNPMMKHLAIPTIGQEHFQQWLRLFYQTLHDIAPSPDALSHFGPKARLTPESMLHGIWVRRARDAPHAIKIDHSNV